VTWPEAAVRIVLVIAVAYIFTRPEEEP